MKWRVLTAKLLPVVLVSGCAATGTEGSFCDVAEYIHFRSQQSLEAIIEADEDVVRGIVLNNEKLDRCP
jgi:hypothetical protein